MQRITLEDVAREAGVSRALVSLAYRDRPGVSVGTRARILAVGDRLGYVPDRIAARLASRGGDTIGVFLQDLRNDLFADVHDGLQEVADAAGRHLVLTVGAVDGSRDVEMLSSLQQSRVDLVVAVGLQAGDVEVRAFARRVPVVVVARRVEGVDAVDSDNRAGAAAAVDHLTGLGHRSIAFLANPPAEGYLDRAAGYEAAMRAAGLEPRSVPSSYVRSAAAVDAGRLLDDRDPPTAVFAHNDQAGLGVLDALAARGLRAGSDVSVVGYDDSAASRLPGTGLTSVDIHGTQLGRDAGRLALARLSDPGRGIEVVTSIPSLVVRASTGPPRQDSTRVISKE